MKRVSLVVFTLIVSTAVVVLAGVYLGKQNLTADAKLPLLVIFGVIALFSALALVAFGLAGLNLADKTQALVITRGVDSGSNCSLPRGAVCHHIRLTL